MARKKYKLLTYEDRKKLEEMYLNNERPSDIADNLQRIAAGRHGSA